jgi:hypothetical protein
MPRWYCWLGLVLLALFVISGCGGDEKGANKEKEKPKPAAK